MLFQFFRQEFHEVEAPGDTDVGGELHVLPVIVAVGSGEIGHRAVGDVCV